MHDPAPPSLPHPTHRGSRADLDEELHRRSAHLALGSEVGFAFTRAQGLDDMLQRCCEAIVRHLDAAFARIWTLTPDATVLELRASAGIYTHLDGAHARVPVGKYKIGRIAATATPHLTNDVPNDPEVSDHAWAAREGMVGFAGQPLVVEGRVTGVMAMFARAPLSQDTLDAFGFIADSVALGIERKMTEARLREERETLDTLNAVGRSLAAELDQDRLVQDITDRATRLTGAQFGAFFYNLVNESGESYTLYTISGVPREAFSRFPMPRNTAVFAPTFNGEGVVRVADITADPRYGHNAPYHGMPKGHLPVRSYLAVPVVSRAGTVIGGLFFGHSEPGVFTERAETLIIGVAAQAAIAMDNARLFKESKALIRALERSNADLDQFAYVASHDLRAPLRGIANLSEWLEEDLGPILPPESRAQMDLLRGRVRRMEALIDGVLDYARAGRAADRVEDVDVAAVVGDVVQLLGPVPEGTVEVRGELPRLRTQRAPLQQVLLNLVGNALKHGRASGVHVVVSAVEVAGNWEITVADDGVGIAPEYHEKVFGMFQTLAARDVVESTGIGLAVVKKVVESRGGRVRLRSAVGEGAAFSFTWPVEAA
jgi:signal transduction histidine kinase